MERGCRIGESNQFPQFSKKCSNGDLLVLTALLIAISVVYGTSVRYGFASEDFSFLSQINKDWTTMLRHLLPIDVRHYEIAETHARDYRPISPMFYRPLAEFYFYLNYKIFGLSPKIMHLENLFLHFINSVLLYFVSLRLLRDRPQSFLVSFLYCVSPVFFSVLFVLPGIQDVLLHFAVLSGLLFVMKGRMVMACLAFLFGLMSKDSAIMMPPMFILYSLIIEGRSGIRYYMKSYGPFFLVGLLYLACKILFMPTIPGAGSPYEMSVGPYTLLHNLFESIEGAAGHTALLPAYFFWPNAGPAVVMATIIFLAALIPLLIMASRRYGWRLTLFSLLWFLGWLAPYVFLKRHFQYYYLALSLVGFLLVVIYSAGSAIKDYLGGWRHRFLKPALVVFCLAYLVIAARNTYSHETYDIATNRPIVAGDIVRGMKKLYPTVPRGTKFIFITPWQGAIVPDMPQVIYYDPTLITYDVRNVEPLNYQGTVQYYVRSEGGMIPVDKTFRVLYYSYEKRVLLDVSESFSPGSKSPYAISFKDISHLVGREYVNFSRYKSVW